MIQSVLQAGLGIFPIRSRVRIFGKLRQFAIEQFFLFLGRPRPAIEKAFLFELKNSILNFSKLGWFELWQFL